MAGIIPLLWVDEVFDLVLPTGAGFDEGGAAGQAPALKDAKRDVSLGEAVKLCMLPVTAPPPPPPPPLVDGPMLLRLLMLLL